MDVGLYDHAEEGPVDAPATLEQGRKERSLAQFRDLELEIPGLGGERARTVAIALGGAGLVSLEPAGSDVLGRLRLDQSLVDELGAPPDGINVATSTDRFEQLMEVRLVQGHWVFPFEV